MRAILAIVCALIFLLHQYVQWGLGISTPWLDAYLDPFCSIPILLYLLDWEGMHLKGRSPMSQVEILAAVIVFTLIFELLFPALSQHFTADIWDGLAYLLGGGCYILAGRSTA